MAKEQKKYQVTRMLTEGGIKNIGGNLWVQKTILSFMGLLVIGFVLSLFLSKLLVNSWLGSIPLIAVLLWWYLGMIKAGNKYWDKVKDKKEPIDLG